MEETGSELSVHSHCSGCGRTEVDLGRKIRTCGRCRTVHYCNQGCQTDDWPAHRSSCRFRGWSPMRPDDDKLGATPPLPESAPTAPKRYAESACRECLTEREANVCRAADAGTCSRLGCELPAGGLVHFSTRLYSCPHRAALFVPERYCSARCRSRSRVAMEREAPAAEVPTDPMRGRAM